MLAPRGKGTAAGVLLVNLPSNTVSNPVVKYVSTKFRLRDLPNPLFSQIYIRVSIPFGGGIDFFA
jgi:hypothetical protein